MSLLPPSPASPTPAADSYVQRLREAQEILPRELLKARKAMETLANRRRRPAPHFLPGQLVWLMRRHISTTRPSSKLDVRRLGPFAVIGPVGSSAFKLSLPPSMHVHPVFHVSLLEPHVANTFQGRVVEVPLPIQVDGIPEFEVNSILDSRFRRRKLYYFLDWVGYDESERTWEPATNITNAAKAISDFHRSFPSKPHLFSPAT